MYWARIDLGRGVEADVIEKFRAQYAALGEPRDMMLVIDARNPRQRLFMGIPNLALFVAYQGVERCLGSDVPDASELVVGHLAVFQAAFRDRG